jgi:hypothetical protein
LLTIFRNLGDSIAFTFINSYDIKPQSFKQSSGFISGKKGSRLERKCLRHTFNSGGIAILNDLTNCLRHFDLTIIIAKDVWIPVEIKSGRSPSKRDNRQKQKYTELMEFLIEDKPTDIFQKGYLSHRVSINKSPRNYVKVLNKCIEMSVQNGQIIKEVEDGLYFVINYNSEIAKDELFNNLNKLNLQQPYFFFLNNELINDSGFYPICLTLRKAEYFIDLLTSKLEIIVIFDSVYLKEKFEKRKLNFLQLDDDDDFVFQVEGIINNEPFEFKIGRYLINKMFFEFLSSSLLYNSIDHFAVLATTLVTDAQLHFQKHKNPNMVY